MQRQPSPPPQTAYISFLAEINVSTAEQLLGVIYQQVARGAQRIYLLFATPGGLIDPGIAVYNQLNGLSVDLVIHNVGNVDSVGNAIFMAGKTRLACKHSSFLFHGTKWNLPGPTALAPRDVDEILQNLGALERKIAGLVSEKTSLKIEEVNRFFVSSQSVNPSEALERGIIHRIEDVSLPP
ncbi:MAG: ATP-dependent Clp protease proteolytic subunit [Candidatus Lambdaproteobacteria bacterium]|nr:ATP-dependent Clp protease proteolytic subunit [Candidatus Lambdaproteobacteria bacterium]